MKPFHLHFQNPNLLLCPSPSPSPSPSMAFSTALRVLRLSPFLQPSRLRLSPSHPRLLSPFQHRLISARASRRPAAAARAVRRSDGNGSVTATTESGNSSEGRVVPTELHKEATEAYMAYAMSVLLGRALPDVRDGLKPVHRRILFAMHELGLSSKKPFKKCARVVGEVLGKFHPHGDTAVYDSLVRMAQDFSLRSPLIQGHGNFGSIDADPPAAMRYTECRLDDLTEALLLADLEQDTVDFVPNFDNSQKEPSLLPARLPTLLLNGSSGIAVGMATNIPPHNLGEVVDVLCVLIHNPEATLQELLEYMPGPDFPTGGLIMGNLGILEAYRTGRGRVVIRGKTDIELLDSKTKRTAIIIKEIPYQTNKASLVEKIAELVENKSLDGISDIRDESDRSGMRIVIELKRGSDPSIVLNNLYRLTSLQSTFSCNMVGILNGQPKQMGLKELLQAFLDFRCSVVERRALFKLSQARGRKHIVEGILIGFDNLDEVICIIREASSNSAAAVGLRNAFGLSEKQAEALLDISLRRLTLRESGNFLAESKSLMEQISKLEELLSSRKNILELIEQEAIELKNKFANPRRSMLEDTDNGQLEDIDVIPNEDMLLALSEKGYLKRMKPSTFNLQNRGTVGKSVGKLRVNDSMSDFIVCRAHDHVLYFSDKGTVYSARAYKIPECSRTAAGTPLVHILSLSDGERITSIIPVSEFVEDQFLLMLTMQGYIKRVSLNLFSSIRSTGIIAIQLVPDDELKWVRLCTNDDLVAMASHNGMVMLCQCSKIRTLSRNTRGSPAMRLKNGDSMASVDIIPAAMWNNLETLSKYRENSGKGQKGPWLLFVSENGHGKRVPLSSFRVSSLNRVGLVGYKFSAEDRLAAVFVVGFSLAEDGESDEQVVLVSHSGTVNRIKVRDISIQSRFARGVILMRLDHAGKIQSASLISATDCEPEEEVLATAQG
ncbi:DNA gyrase subunit A, chloroplastic/mitochondrial [Vigna unguiculata]|uniref:DNA gyrase subunit A, chloroplastic/mitochondrial n=1 Tax=Vigna unguiculata TaxID=3917 RepID=UPI001016E6AB|nr:DNA gyrase subunit A, chloroplastic/mitochondrial [Vigna unguiculata]